MDEEYSIKYDKMNLKYSYSYRKSLIKINENIQESNLLLDVISAAKLFNDVKLENTVYNGEKVIFNVSTILKIIKFALIAPLFFNVISVIFFIIAYITKDVDVLILVKTFSVLSLSTILFCWLIWSYNYMLYIKELDANSYEFISDDDLKKIDLMLKFNFILLGIK